MPEWGKGGMLGRDRINTHSVTNFDSLFLSLFFGNDENHVFCLKKSQSNRSIFLKANIFKCSKKLSEPVSRLGL